MDCIECNCGECYYNKLKTFLERAQRGATGVTGGLINGREKEGRGRGTVPCAVPSCLLLCKKDHRTEWFMK